MQPRDCGTTWWAHPLEKNASAMTPMTVPTIPQTIATLIAVAFMMLPETKPPSGGFRRTTRLTLLPHVYRQRTSLGACKVTKTSHGRLRSARVVRPSTQSTSLATERGHSPSPCSLCEDRPIAMCRHNGRHESDGPVSTLLHRQTPEARRSSASPRASMSACSAWPRRGIRLQPSRSLRPCERGHFCAWLTSDSATIMRPRMQVSMSCPSSIANGIRLCVTARRTPICERSCRTIATSGGGVGSVGRRNWRSIMTT